VNEIVEGACSRDPSRCVYVQEYKPDDMLGDYSNVEVEEKLSFPHRDLSNEFHGRHPLARQEETVQVTAVLLHVIAPSRGTIDRHSGASG